MLPPWYSRPKTFSGRLPDSLHIMMYLLSLQKKAEIHPPAESISPPVGVEKSRGRTDAADDG
ncbi:hypothetical protein CGZ65_05825 [Neisseria weixii]|nr:hypothetical protein CGZ65_05825 [Neisseria weixii]